MHATSFVVLCLAAVVRSADAVAPEDAGDDGDKGDMLFQVHSSGRVQHTAQEDAPFEEISAAASVAKGARVQHTVQEDSLLEESQPHHRYGCDRFTTRTRIRNDDVEHELSYARTGSPMPEVFHGIFWMDQRGRNVNRRTTPNYRQKGSVAADELLATFGDSSWDPDSRCLSATPPFGGQKGHWTWLDSDGRLDNFVYNINCGIQAHIRFCCRDRHCHRIDLTSYVNARDAMEYFASPDWHGLGWIGRLISQPILAGLHYWNGHSENFWIPTDVQSWHMIKKPWGFDRLTVMCSSCWSWLQTHYHYPLFQIVDGNGQRTEHYEAYLRFANQDTNAQTSTFDEPRNRGNGTSFVGRARR